MVGLQARASFRRASVGGTVLGGAIAVGLGLSYLATMNRGGSAPSKKDQTNKGGGAAAAGAPSKKNTAVYAFGYNQWGQLMLGDQADVYTPKKVNFMQDRVMDICAASKTSALLTEKGHVYTAGSGLDGRLGTGITIPPLSAPDQTNPMRVPQLENIVRLELGEFGGAAVNSEGRLFTWGRNWGGENGRAEDATPGLPETVQHSDRIVDISRGRQHLAFVDGAGRLFTCGVGREGALGHGSFENVTQPKQVVTGVLRGGSVHVKSVACGRDSTFCVTEDGKLLSFGNDDYGTLGLGKSDRRVPEPRLVSSLAAVKVAHVSCGEGFAAVLSEDGDLYLGGRGSDGQLANGTRDDSSFFIKVLNLPGPVARVSCGGGHVAALLRDGSLYVWGRGRNGQMGRSDHIESVAAPRLTPVECSFFREKRILSVACGGDHTVVLVEED